MTQTPLNNDPSSQQAASQRPPKSPLDRCVKIGFLIVLVIAGAVLWFRQKHDPQLPGWNENLSTALQQAKADNRQILIFFTEAPMSYNDKHAVKNVVTTPRTENALNKLLYLRVHLNINDHKAEAGTYKVQSTPTYLLLDSNGRELKRTSGLMNDVTFIGSFLTDTQP
jgi:thioredoxin-related protein